MVHEPVAATSLSRRGEASVPQARSGSGHRLSGLVRESAHRLARANGVVATNPVAAANGVVATNPVAAANRLLIGY